MSLSELVKKEIERIEEHTEVAEEVFLYYKRREKKIGKYLKVALTAILIGALFSICSKSIKSIENKKDFVVYPTTLKFGTKEYSEF